MKTVHFIYQGPSVNLGRFGNIPKGTSLPLNSTEARGVMRDPRFKESDKPFERYEFEPSDPKASLYDHLNQQFEINEAAKD